MYLTSCLLWTLYDTSYVPWHRHWLRAEMDLFVTCPQLVVQNHQQTLYEGFIDVSVRMVHKLQYFATSSTLAIV